MALAEVVELFKGAIRKSTGLTITVLLS